MALLSAATETERLRTEVEELGNSLDRILDTLRDEKLSEAERVERAVAIATHARNVLSHGRQSRHASFRG